MRVNEILIESYPFRNKEKVYSLLYKTIDSGPFDGGCVIFAEALQLLYGGDIVVLVGHAQRGVKHESAQHAALLLNDHLIDADGKLPPRQFIERFTKNELAHAGGNITGVRPIEPNDLPDAPRDSELVKKIAKLL